MAAAMTGEFRVESQTLGIAIHRNHPGFERYRLSCGLMG